MALSVNGVFSKFVVQPSYGVSKAALVWNLISPMPGARVLLFRSITGGTAPWLLLTEPTGVPASQGFFEDDISTANENSAQKIFYRACLVHEGTEYDGPVVGFTSWLAPNELKHVARILRNEMRLMHTNDRGAISGNGIPMLMLAPLESGRPASDYDPLTKQLTGQGGRPGPDDSYGMPFIGGFGAPSFTWVRLIAAQDVITDNANGAGQVAGNSVKARFLAFPRPMAGFMLVNPATDDRYIIGDALDEFTFKGIVPVAYEAQMNRLERSSPKYRLPVSIPSFPV